MPQYETLSYASIHWPDEYGNPEPLHPWLIDVAKIQDTIHDAANKYAEARNYDYADRIIRVGSNLVELALTVCHLEADPTPQKNRYQRVINGHLNQSLHDAQDRIRIPTGRRGEYYENGGTDSIPAELADLFQNTWREFKSDKEIQLSDIKVWSIR